MSFTKHTKKDSQNIKNGVISWYQDTYIRYNDCGINCVSVGVGCSFIMYFYSYVEYQYQQTSQSLKNSTIEFDVLFLTPYSEELRLPV